MSVSAASNAIITTALVKDYLAIGSTDSTHDDFFQTWINYVSEQIEGPRGIDNKVVVCGIVNEIRNGNGRTRMRPKYFPLVSLGDESDDTESEKLASLQYRTSLDGSWTDIETDIDAIVLNNPSLFELSAQNSYNIQLLNKYFPEGNQNIRMSYRAGWSTVPTDLVLVCLEKVVEIYRMSSKEGGGRFGVSSVSKNEAGGNKSTTYKDFNDIHQKMMKPYKRRI